MSQAPLTFLFTDLQGSSRLWEQFPDIMPQALARHDALLRESVEAHGGRVIKTTGDGLHAVFDAPAAAVAAALAGQLAIKAESWPEATGPLRVRMGLHTGVTNERDGDYYGPAVNRAARVMAAGHGGQVLLTRASCALVSDSLPEAASLMNLGEHRLKDLAEAEEIYQLCHPGLAADFPPLNTLSAFKHNLPVQLTSFVGRKRELEEIRRLFTAGGPTGGGVRALTLLGPGGTGKTRLALQAAADMLDRFPDGAWLVELAPLTDPDLIAERIASVFGLQEQHGLSFLDTLTQYLRRKDLLLVLDNVEHLVRDSAELAEQLLLQCPDLRLLVTGREALFIGGETTLQIPSLSLPKKLGAYEDSLPPDAIAESEAVQLFLARAQAVRPDFSLSAENAAAVAEIVRRLDGIPLALELAAARLRMMSAPQIAERLNDRFRLLTGGRRTALERQQTLQALIDWSWNLLDENEQVLLRRFSVFSGGWSLEAAQAVAGFDPPESFDVIDLLEQLINKSLVFVENLADSDMRYQLLESIRQYARDRLFEAGEGEDLRNRHAEYYAAFTEMISEFLTGPEMLVWLDRFLRETDNARAAREWALESRLDLAIRFAAAPLLVQRYWYFSPDGRRWLEALVAKAREQVENQPGIEARKGLAAAIIAYGSAMFGGGESALARRIMDEGVALARETGETRLLVFGLNMQMIASLQLGEFQATENLAKEALALSASEDMAFLRMMTIGSFTPIFSFMGKHDLAAAYTEEAVRLARELDNPWVQAMSLHLTGWLEKGRGNLQEASAAFTRAAELFEAVRDPAFRYISLSEAGHIQRQLGSFRAAEDIYRKTIRFFQEASGKSAVIHQLESFGMTAAYQGQFERAAKLLGSAAYFREREESVRLPPEKVEFEAAVAYLRSHMTADSYEAAVAEGTQMRIDEAVEYALHGAA